MYLYGKEKVEAVQYKGGIIREDDYPKWFLKAVKEGIISTTFDGKKWYINHNSYNYTYPQGTYVVKINGGTGPIVFVSKYYFKKKYKEI